MWICADHAPMEAIEAKCCENAMLIAALSSSEEIIQSVEAQLVAILNQVLDGKDPGCFGGPFGEVITRIHLLQKQAAEQEKPEEENAVSRLWRNTRRSMTSMSRMVQRLEETR